MNKKFKIDKIDKNDLQNCVGMSMYGHEVVPLDLYHNSVR
jgi:hypothetical protein